LVEVLFVVVQITQPHSGVLVGRVHLEGSAIDLNRILCALQLIVGVGKVPDRIRLVWIDGLVRFKGGHCRFVVVLAKCVYTTVVRPHPKASTQACRLFLPKGILSSLGKGHASRV